MTAISGLLSSVSWTSKGGLFASPGFGKPYRFNLNIQGGTFRKTGMDGSGVIVESNGPLPYGWSGSITFRAPGAPASGYSGSVTWSAYSTNIREWSLDLRCGEKDVTAFDGAGIVARSFIPMLWSWGGTFAGYIDSSTALALPTAASGSSASLTLKLLENGAGTDDTFAGNALTTQLTSDVGIESGGDFSYSFDGDGTLTAAGDNLGTNSNGIFDDTTGQLITPSATSLVLTAATGRTYTGDAFPTGLSLRCAVDSGVEGTLTFRGTGALTPA